MFAAVILFLSITASSSLSSNERECLSLSSRPHSSYVWPNNTVNYLLDSSLQGHGRLKRFIRQAIQEWESFSCIKFKDYTARPRDVPRNANRLKFSFTQQRTCALGNQQSPSCNCERTISLHGSCANILEVEKHIGWHIGINFKPTRDTTELELRQQINSIYSCNSTCLFRPVCHNGGYVVPDGVGGCGKCLCPTGGDCQEENFADPNPNLLTNEAKQGFKGGIGKAFEQMEKKYEIQEKKLGYLSTAATTVVMGMVNGEIEQIPQQLAVDQVEFFMGKSLEKILENVKLGGAIAAGIAAAAASVISDLIQGKFKEAVANAIGAGIGTFVGQAIGAAIGTALAGPLGTVIGEIIGGIIGSVVAELVSWIIKELWPYLEELAALIWQGLQEVFKWLKSLWEDIKDAFWGFALKLAEIFSG